MTRLNPAPTRDVTTNWFDRILMLLLPGSLHRLVRFGMAGIISTLFFVVIVNVLVLGFDMGPVVASAVGYLIALSLSYVLQSRFAFRASGNQASQITRFLITSVAGLGSTYVLMALICNVLHWPYNIGTVAVAGFVSITNYIVFTIWVFRQVSTVHPSDRAANRGD